MSLGSLLRKLEERDLILPYFESSITGGNWPDEYTVTIDSRPYYGLADLDGQGNKGGAGDGYFHPSTHSMWSRRKLFYAFHPEYGKQAVEPKKTLQGEMTLSMGSALHGIIQAQMVQSGLLREENVEFEYVNEVHKCRGRIDFIVDHPRGDTIPVELKTVNSYSFAKLEGVRDYWDAQLSMGLDNSGHDFGILLALESGWPYRMREFHVQRNDQLLSEIYEKFDDVRDYLKADILPPGPCCTPGERAECPFRYVDSHE